MNLIEAWSIVRENLKKRPLDLKYADALKFLDSNIEAAEETADMFAAIVTDASETGFATFTFPEDTIGNDEEVTFTLCLGNVVMDGPLNPDEIQADELYGEDEE